MSYALVRGLGRMSEERIATEELRRLRRAEELYRLTVENVSDAIFVTDDAGAWRYICPNAHNIFGWSHVEISRMAGLQELLGRDIIDHVELDRHGEIVNREVEARDRAGERHLLLANIKRVKIVDGTILVVLRDITRRHQLEQQLGQQRRLEAIDRFAAGVAHDLSNLLGVILAHAEDAQEDIAAVAKHDLSSVQQALTSIEQAVDDSAVLVSDLSAFSHGTPRAPEPVDVTEVIRASAATLSGVAEPSKLSLSLEGDLPEVTFNRSVLLRVLVNLVVNAKEALEQASTIELFASRRQLDATTPMACGIAAEPGDYVVVGVRDEGPGMDSATLDRIFEPYFSTKGDGGGLGLASSLSLARGVGGRLHADSTPGQGTTVALYLKPAAR